MSNSPQEKGITFVDFDDDYEPGDIDERKTVSFDKERIQRETGLKISNYFWWDEEDPIIWLVNEGKDIIAEIYPDDFCLSLSDVEGFSYHDKQTGRSFTHSREHADIDGWLIERIKETQAKLAERTR